MAHAGPIPVEVVAHPEHAGSAQLLMQRVQALQASGRVAVLHQPDTERSGLQAAASLEALTGACLCCTGELAWARQLGQMVRKDHPDVIVIEAPWGADPAALARILRQPTMRGLVRLENLCVGMPTQRNSHDEAWLLAASLVARQGAPEPAGPFGPPHLARHEVLLQWPVTVPVPRSRALLWAQTVLQSESVAELRAVFVGSADSHWIEGKASTALSTTSSGWVLNHQAAITLRANMALPESAKTPPQPPGSPYATAAPV